MENRIREILSNEYKFLIEKLEILPGGFCPDETYIVITNDQHKYVVKYIEYDYSFEHLESILKFENLLYDLYKYPCPQIILSEKNQYVIQDNKRFLFVQTFIQGIEPTKEIFDKDQTYLNEMGSLLAKWRIASRQYSFEIQKEEDQEFTDKWWNQHQLDNIDPFLLSNFMECKNKLINLNENFEIGLIHNDFHPNNSVMTNDGKIFVIDFVDATKSFFIADLATSIFHLLVSQENEQNRAKTFLQGYQQIIKLNCQEINSLDLFVRFKLTLSIIEDIHDSIDTNNSFIQSCFHLLHTLNDQPNLVKNLLE